MDTSKPLNRRELAELFEVSLTTVGNWQRQGCPHEPPPEGRRADGCKFNLAEVLQWRRDRKARDHTELGHTRLSGRPLEDMPDEMWFHPEYENGLRLMIRDTIRQYFLTWVHEPAGLNLVLNMLADLCGGDKVKARNHADIVILSLFGALEAFLSQDALNTAYKENGSPGLDDLWYSFTGMRVKTGPPRNKDALEDAAALEIPPWLRLPSEQFVREYWPGPHTMPPKKKPQA